MDVLDAAEAGDLLAEIVCHGRELAPDRLADAAALCTELGYLPLTIEQAGAYIAQTSIAPADYLLLIANYPATMYQETAESGNAQRTTARIWRTTLDHLTDTPPRT